MYRLYYKHIRKTTTKRGNMNAREENKAVREALKAEGIKARVGHGAGTTRFWIQITVNADDIKNNYSKILRIAAIAVGREKKAPEIQNIIAWSA